MPQSSRDVPQSSRDVPAGDDVPAMPSWLRSQPAMQSGAGQGYAPNVAPQQIPPEKVDEKKDEEKETARLLKEKQDLEAAVKNTQKCHNEWDRRRREYNSVLIRSGKCEQTSGSKFENDLGKLVTETDLKDPSPLGYRRSLRRRLTAVFNFRVACLVVFRWLVACRRSTCVCLIVFDLICSSPVAGRHVFACLCSN